MEKLFISANELLLDSFKLGEQIFRKGFRPSFIIGIWRGGAPVGIAVQEFLDVRGITTDHIAIRTASYYGIDQQEKHVQVFGLNYVLENARVDHPLLIVDDVFDSGRSVKAVIDEIRSRAVKVPATIKIACAWYKPERNVTDLRPDFYIHTTDRWLVFPHELKGLTRDEIIRGKGEAFAEVLLGD